MNTNDRPSATDPPGPAAARRPRHGGRARLLACCLAAAALAAAVLVAGCGGGSSDSGSGVAHVNTTSTTAKSGAKSTGKPNTLAFAQCMRSHGVPNFPDPTSSGQLNLNGVNSQSPGVSDC